MSEPTIANPPRIHRAIHIHCDTSHAIPVTVATSENAAWLTVTIEPYAEVVTLFFVHPEDLRALARDLVSVARTWEARLAPVEAPASVEVAS